MVFCQTHALRQIENTVNTNLRNTELCAACNGQGVRNRDQSRKDRFRTSPMPRSPRRLAYIRVSTRAQTTDRQTLALRAECDKLYVEYVSAVADARPVFEKVMRCLQPGDTFVVLDLDRAFRSSVDAMLTAADLRTRNIAFRILS